MTETDTQTQCQLIEKKRNMLAALIRIAQGFNKHTQGLEDVLLLAKPSQTYPPKIDQYITILEKKTSSLSEEQLSKQTKEYDNRCKKLINTLLKAVEQTQKQIGENQDIEPFSEEVQQQLHDFKNMTQTAVGLRAILQKRGIIMPPVHFGFPQEWIAEQIDSLQQTNRALRSRVKILALELIIDVKQMLKRENLSLVLRDGLTYVESSMQENLEHLKSGGSIDKLPHEFENLAITSVPESSFQPEPENETEEKATLEKKPLSFFKKVKLWLSTSRKTRWRDLD